MSMDLNTGYYYILLSEQAIDLCTNILPWGKYRYKHVPMAVSKPPENFQEKMNKFFRGFDFIQAYIDELLITTNDDWYDQLEKLELILKNIKYNRLKCNVKKLFFGQTNMEYLDFWVTQNEIQR